MYLWSLLRLHRVLTRKIAQISGRFGEILEGFFDRFFSTQDRIFWNTLERLFSYLYRETDKGIFGLFNSPEEISNAARQARDKGYKNFDCLTPFPVHGLEEDMGLPRSRIPYITFFAGMVGLLFGFGMQFAVHEQVISATWGYFDAFPNFRSYPLNIGGKPTFSWPAMIPISFEITVLLAGHATVIGLILMSRLFRPGRKVLHPDITSHKFCLWLPAASKNYEEAKARQFLESLGASEITVVDDGSSTS